MKNRDYTLIIDASTSMSTQDQAGGKSRWEILQESTLALATTCEKFDEDGLTVYILSSEFKRYDNVKSIQVPGIFNENQPGGTSQMAVVLQDALNNYFQRKSVGKTKQEGETLLVLTDGLPSDRMAVTDVILRATRRMENAEELAVSFIQIGSDPKVTRFLKSLDDQLQGIGASYDICDTLTLEEMEDISLTEVLQQAISD